MPTFRNLSCLGLVTLVCLALPAGTAAAQDLDGKLERLQGRVEELERKLEDASQEPEGDAGMIPTPAWERAPSGLPGPLRGVYDKPFLFDVWGRAHIGGYTEFEYHAFKNRILGIPEGFRMHRTNLFLFTELTESVRFGSEIEFETEFEGTSPEKEIEVALEMAFVDWAIYDQFVIRGGAILSPLGRVNVNHDGPVRELTDRPLVSTFVIPTTLTEAGVGAHGTFELRDALSFSYEAYVVNGFNLLDANGVLAVPITERERLLREGRTSIGGDNNDRVSTTGRIGLTAGSLLDMGASWHSGTYDERADNRLTILAADLAVVAGGFALEGEVARADFSRDAFARSSGVPDDFWGYYVQGSVSGMPSLLKSLLPHVFDRPGASFTAVLRYDRVDLDGDRGEALEPGINFRPVSDTVFKLSYRYGFKTIGPRSGPGTEGFHDDGFVFSISTYF